MKFFCKIFMIFLFWGFCSDAKAINVIADEETEIFLYGIIKPLYKEAGITFNPNKIFIVNDPSLNAFVGDGNNLFIHTGTIIAAGNKAEIEGVIAHETGHILGGHILRLKLHSQELQKASLASLIAAGAAAVVSGRGDIAMAVALGSQSSLLNSYIAYRVEEERSADEAAVKLLSKMEKSPEGIKDFMKRIQRQNIGGGVEENSYFRTHPMTAERINFLTNAADKSPYSGKETDNEEFYRVRAKLIAYLDTPKKTMQIFPKDNKSIPARYARAIAYFKMLQIDNAFKELDELIALEPNNPFFHELKGQIYLETGKAGPAKKEYKKALEILPNSANFQLNLAQATLEDNPSREELLNIVNILNKATISKPSGYNWLLLSRAYGLLNDAANSNYAAAEFSASIGEFETAQRQANEAKKHNTSPKLALKIDDLLAKLEPLVKEYNSRRRRM